MKVFTGIIIAASATKERIGLRNSWPANTDAPHCGCQMIVDPAEYGGYINSTCTIRFPYADNIKRYGRHLRSDPHFVSIASTYMVGRNRDDFSQQIYGPDGFKFTGFDEVSNPDALDILVFYEEKDCARPGRDISELPKHGGDLPQDQWWEVFNLTTAADGITNEGQTNALCEFQLECVPYGGALPGVHLGNFNYDIARSVQTYTVPIYGLEKNQQATFNILDYYQGQNNCANPLAHSGHGTASGCSTNTTCSNELTFDHNKDHNGLLEYFQFEPVSLINNPNCALMPEHHEEDYKWLTPSPWDTQENYEPTDWIPDANEQYRNEL